MVTQEADDVGLSGFERREDAVPRDVAELALHADLFGDCGNDVAVIADDVATAVKDTFLPTDFLTGENALRNLAAFLLCHRCHDGKTKLAITVHCPNVVRYKENFNAEIAKFAGKLKGIDSVAGKAADLTGDDQVEFATFGIGKHFHEGRALFGGGSGDALVDILCLL